MPPDDPMPDEKPTLIDALAVMTDEIKGLREDVRDEREGREQTLRATESNHRLARVVSVALACVLAAGLVIGGLTLKWYVDGHTISCETRSQSREDTRAMGKAVAGAATDEVARYGKLTPAERAMLDERVAKRAEAVAFQKLPPLNC